MLPESTACPSVPCSVDTLYKEVGMGSTLLWLTDKSVSSMLGRYRFSSSNLSLAGSGRWAVGAGSRRNSAVTVGLQAAIAALVVPRVHDSCNIWDLGVLERASGFAGSGALAVFLVGCKVEGDEEDEVGADDTHSGESGKFLSGAFARVRHPGEVGRGEVGVGCEINEA